MNHSMIRVHRVDFSDGVSSGRQAPADPWEEPDMMAN